MRISIFGLGYVGCVTLGCFAKNGDHIIGIDVNPVKVNLINSGKSTIIEKDIDCIIEKGFRAGRIKATTDYKKAVVSTDVSIICVGTPSSDEGHLSLNHIYKVAEQIGESLIKKSSFHTIVIRSTVSPGTNKKVADIIEKISNKKKNYDFGIVSNPEFLREGTSVQDFYNPPMIVLGGDNNKALKIVEKMYSNIDAPLYKVECEVAEIIKYINNSFHALKVVFANEVGNICKGLGIDSHRVMDLFCKDKQLNISSYYLKPGSAYGGSCLPKDLRALNVMSKQMGLKTYVLGAINKSNKNHEKNALDLIMESGKRKIGILGLSFKEGTDDLRCSPTVNIVKKLMEMGFKVKIYDKWINVSNLLGINKEYVERTIPNISNILSNDIKYVADNSEVLVICTKEKEFFNIPNNYSNKIIIDLVRIAENINYECEYKGICW